MSGAAPDNGATRELTEAHFRANPAYELVLLDRLTPAERERLDGDVAGELYGVLRPRQACGLPLRAVSHETALLLFTLQQPGPLPAYVRSRLATGLHDAVARLVLDSVLEIDASGVFVSGAHARDLILHDARASPSSRLATLSREALQYAQALRGLSADDLALRLYSYGRRPVSPAWSRRLSDVALLRFLGLGTRGAVQAVIDAAWVEIPAGSERTAWKMWHPASGAASRTGPGYKLYVSPAMAAVPEALLAVAEILADVPGARGFKVGADLAGLCRPDKLVAYFSRLEDLQTAARRLEARLEGVNPHGVPFTSEVTRGGLLSWGIDPPPGNGSGAGLTRGSWRFWVVRRLGEYLLTAVETDATTPPWQFALDRLMVDGVDTRTWAPTTRLWTPHQ